MSAHETDAATGADSSTTGDSKRWIALAIVMTAAFMDLVDATIVNIAIPSIEDDLGA
ncbi:MFS transporter, partial [Streptomyces hydrogenans]